MELKNYTSILKKAETFQTKLIWITKVSHYAFAMLMLIFFILFQFLLFLNQPSNSTWTNFKYFWGKKFQIIMWKCNVMEIANDENFSRICLPFSNIFSLLYFHFWFSNFLANFKEKFVLVCVPYLLKKGKKYWFKFCFNGNYFVSN